MLALMFECSLPACLHTCTESELTHYASNKTNTGKNLLSLSNVKDAKAKMSTCLSSLPFLSLIPLQCHIQEKARRRLKRKTDDHENDVALRRKLNFGNNLKHSSSIIFSLDCISQCTSLSLRLSFSTSVCFISPLCFFPHAKSEGLPKDKRKRVEKVSVKESFK